MAGPAAPFEVALPASTVLISRSRPITRAAFRVAAAMASRGGSPRRVRTSSTKESTIAGTGLRKESPSRLAEPHQVAVGQDLDAPGPLSIATRAHVGILGAGAGQEDA